MVLLRVDTDKLKPSFTCTICLNIVEKPTTLTVCLHTFCWKCIHGKITEHAWRCCPVCYAELGAMPLKKLKHDEFMEKLRETFFPPQEVEVIHVESDTESSESYEASEASSSEDMSDGDNSAC